MKNIEKIKRYVIKDLKCTLNSDYVDAISTLLSENDYLRLYKCKGNFHDVLDELTEKYYEIYKFFKNDFIKTSYVGYLKYKSYGVNFIDNKNNKLINTYYISCANLGSEINFWDCKRKIENYFTHGTNYEIIERYKL